MSSHVVIIGGGFGGLTAARSLKKAPAEITVIDRRNHHLFQPLLYQVATAGLSPANIAAPIRGVLKNQKNANVAMADVTGIDLQRRKVQMKDREISFDYLIVATGSWYHYFGHPEWHPFAPGLKSVTDATQIRRKILLAFESAEVETDPEKRQAHLTFVLVGAGPTGVEMAGSIAELAQYALESDFRHIDPKSTRIILIEAGPRVLAQFPESLSRKAADRLKKMGIEIRCQARVEKVDEQGVLISGTHIYSKNVIWCAGVVASPAGKWLGAQTDRMGRVMVNSDLSIPGHPHVFVIGDTAHFEQDGQPLPGVAPVAMQQGRYVAQVIQQALKGHPRPKEPFRYFNKGNLATVGRSFAVVHFGKIRASGMFAWLIWLVVHIYYLIGYRNRILVLIEWAWAYLTYQRGARLITRDSTET
jgi:NADH dehydrogenase